jgi:hypothetical protein
MQASVFNSTRTIVALALLAAAPAAHSAMYRWVELNGATTYSDQLPHDPSKVRALTVLQAPAPPSAFEKRSQELVDAERGRPGDNTTAGRATQPHPGRDADAGMRGMNDPDPQPRTLGSGELQGGARLSGVRPSQPEAPRDPCLRSSDPRCYEKNRDAYVPYLGYSPSTTRGTLSGVGASSGVSAGGAVGGSVSAGGNESTIRRAKPWQLRNTLKDAKDLK